MNLYFVRHGLARHNLPNPETIPFDPAFAEREPFDTSLTPQGERQAVRCGKRLSGIKFDAVLVSPFHRTLQTAAAIAREQEIPPRLEILHDLCECGTTEFPDLPENLRTLVYPEIVFAEGNRPIPKVEQTAHVLWERACRVRDYVWNRFGGDETLLLVSSGAFMNQYLVEAFLEMPEEQAMKYCLGAENCCITCLKIPADRSKYFLISLDETGHLGEDISREPFDL